MTRPPVQPLGAYPRLRLRRNRRDDWSRRLVAEHRLTRRRPHLAGLRAGRGARRATPIPSMPGVERLSIEVLVDAAGEAQRSAFPPSRSSRRRRRRARREDGDEALNPDNLVCRAVRAVKKAHPELGVHVRRGARSLHDPRP